MNKTKTIEIAIAIFNDGGRSRDNNVRSQLKTKYDGSFAEEVLEQLAMIEYDYLTKR